ncbi:hypothetical protein DUNSADRAFT_17640 [Dunaliella salina]|uniref:Encoded protein n=1 Tax=Dunaliella salina TaxID=3046 RepID=A0ABQ7GZY2_DUNSA|nr:hypothetical protein DUNSADRAFT_17640 [Dunaliella salina]|eukprot:KAF5840156.1 hypothetical protein DUNSADRAFT_17640 [Dunaliella salina]
MHIWDMPGTHIWCTSGARTWSMPSARNWIMSGSHRCQAPINRVERYPREGGIFISPATLQSFKTEDELIAHTRKVHQHLSVAATNAERRAAAAARARAGEPQQQGFATGLSLQP